MLSFDQVLLMQCARRKAERNAENARKLQRENARLKRNVSSLECFLKEANGRIAELERIASKHHLRAIVSEQSAERIRSAVTEAAEMTDDDVRLIRALDNEGLHHREIAEKFETDLLTVACILEGVA